MTHVITVTLDGHATGEFEPSLPVIAEEGGTLDGAFRADLASGVSSFIGQNFGTDVFQGTITVTWTNENGVPVIEET